MPVITFQNNMFMVFLYFQLHMLLGKILKISFYCRVLYKDHFVPYLHSLLNNCLMQSIDHLVWSDFL